MTGRGGRDDNEAMGPDLPIWDPHHHLQDLPHNRYPVRNCCKTPKKATPWSRPFRGVELGSSRSDGPEEMRPVAETEFVQAISIKE